MTCELLEINEAWNEILQNVTKRRSNNISIKCDSSIISSSQDIELPEVTSVPTPTLA
jgi:hypothetical protein